VYMTLAQLGVARPAADAQDGWAWAGSGTAAEAHAIADFVTNTLRAAPPGLPMPAAPSDSPVSADPSRGVLAAAQSYI
jgi:hypothetical protein